MRLKRGFERALDMVTQDKGGEGGEGEGGG